MYIQDVPLVIVPEGTPSKNTTVEAVRRTLDELASLSKLDFAGGEVGAYQDRISFRDLAAFMFQPQNIVANPEVLFYKADTHQHRQKLITIFPYILDAVTAEVLQLQHELAFVSKDLRRKEHELVQLTAVSEKWSSDVRARVDQAIELGLVRASKPNDMTLKELIDVLEQATITNVRNARVELSSVDSGVDELLRLRDEETETANKLSAERSRMAAMLELRQSASKYDNALVIQRDRLKIADWISTYREQDSQCPLCGNNMTEASDELEMLFIALRDIERDTGTFSSVPAAFDREFERVRSTISNLIERLAGIRSRVAALEASSDGARQFQSTSLETSKFIGMAQRTIEIVGTLADGGELKSDVERLRTRVDYLQRELRKAEVGNRIDAALRRVNELAGSILPMLDAENPDYKVELVIQDLTVRIISEDRDDYLWEIGSGSNWLSYHVAITLALHQYFLTIAQSPVPSLIIYDQPSQVYFPRKLSVKNKDNEEIPEPESVLSDEDSQAVAKFFNAFGDIVGNAEQRLQIIIFDHAGPEVWGEHPDIFFVDEWRRGAKLVPQDWIAKLNT